LDASAHYDLVVNTSFGNTFANRAPRGLYYVHFPMPNAIESSWSRITWPVASVNPLAHWIERSSGFWLREFPGNGHWTKGDARLDLVVPRDVELPFSLSLSASPWPSGRTPRARVVVGDDVLFDGEVPRKRTPVRATIVGRGPLEPIIVRIESDSF